MGDIGPGSTRAAVRETHSAVVFLVGDRAYKIKKAVDLGFLDFRGDRARREACRRELELNRRLAPDVYLDTVTLTGGDGTVHEHGLLMRRMPDDRRLAALVRSGADVRDHLTAVARVLADFHASAQRDPRISAEGTADALARRWRENLRQSRSFRSTILGSEVFDEIATMAPRYAEGRRSLFDARVAAGFVVDGHGDLLADDIFCLDDGPRILDCIEFDDRLRWVDVLDDAAFLAMDLERLGHPALGRHFLDAYVAASGVPDLPSLEHHFLAYRAFVRAKVSCLQAAQGRQDAAGEAREHARLAVRHLRAGEVVLVLVGGGPGTGKTTVAHRLAEQLDAVVLGTDALRPEVVGSAADAERYDDAARAAVYEELLARARDALSHGRSVVADATWTDAAGRTAAGAVADITASRLVALECRVPVEVAAARAQRRLDTGGSASEAGAAVARRLGRRRDPWPGAVPLDTAAGPGPAVAAALRAVRP